MSDNIKKVKPLYSELIGRLSQAPVVTKENYGKTYDSGLWEQLDSIVDQLNSFTGNDYDRFKLNPENDENWGPFIKISEYRSNLNALIMNLHAEYYNDEVTPFGGAPQTVISQSQNQQQSVSLTMIMEFQSLVDKQLYGNTELTEKERGFLEKVKSNLPSVKTAADLVSTVINIAKATGLDITDLAKVFGL